MGAGRRLILDVLAKAPDGLTARAISALTNVQIKVVYTVAHRDSVLGILTRADDRIVMTEAGRDYMRRAEEKFGPVQQDPPAAPAEGVVN